MTSLSNYYTSSNFSFSLFVNSSIVVISCTTNCICFGSQSKLYRINAAGPVNAMVLLPMQCTSTVTSTLRRHRWWWLPTSYPSIYTIYLSNLSINPFIHLNHYILNCIFHYVFVLCIQSMCLNNHLGNFS